MTTESPLPEQLAPDVRARAEAAFALCGSTIGIGINHVGVLYARIYWLFQPDETPQGPWRLPVNVFPDRHLKPTDFVATALDRQADPSEGWQGADQGPLDGTIYVKTIPSLADGLQAIHYIAKQGEGWESSDNDDTHFERFLRIFEQFVLHLEQGGVYPTLPVPVNPFTSDPASPEPAAEQNRITYLPARLWADLFDLRYRMLVLELWLLMSLPRTDERRSLLIDHAIRVEMRIAIRQIAARLVGLPRKDEAPGGSSSGSRCAALPVGRGPASYRRGGSAANVAGVHERGGHHRAAARVAREQAAAQAAPRRGRGSRHGSWTVSGDPRATTSRVSSFPRRPSGGG